MMVDDGDIRIFKVVAYPAFGVMQLFVARPWWLGPPLMIVLVGLGYLNLKRLLQGRRVKEDKTS